MKSFSIFFLLLVSLAVTAAEAQSAKQPVNRLKSRNPAAILKAEMAIRSLPSKGKACLDRFSMAANGTIRPTINNSSTGQRQCSFFINAPANKLIQMTCSVVRLNSSGSGLAIYGAAEINVNPPVVNRIYTSRSDSLFLFFKVDNTDWFDCKWTTIAVPQTSEYQLCRDGTSTTPNGTIQRSADDTSTDPRMCMFAITVPSDHRIQLMCTNVTLTSPENFLQFQTVSETVIADPPAMNRVYTSTSEIIYLFSQFSNQDSFKCQWTTVMIPPLTNDNKLCREKITKSASGSIQPLMANGPNAQLNSCSFIVEVPPNQLTEISCPVINFTSPGSYLHFSGISDLNMGLTPLTNRVYTSGVDLIHLNSQIDVNKDWFNCTWSAIPAPSTTDFKLCRHGGTTSSSGTLQPFLDGLTTGDARECYFFIDVPLNEEIEISCSSINLSSPGSYLRLVGVSDFDENPPVENGIYLSNGTRVLVYSKFNNGDWFDCIWESTTCPALLTTTSDSSIATTQTLFGKTSLSTTTTMGVAETSTTSSTTTVPTTSTTTSTTPQTTTVSTTTTALPTTSTTRPSTTSSTTTVPTTSTTPSTTTSTTPQTTITSTTTTEQQTTSTTRPSTTSSTTTVPTTSTTPSTTTSTTPQTTITSTTTTEQQTTSTTRPSTTSSTTTVPTTSTTPSTTTLTTPQTTITSTTTTAQPTTSTTSSSTSTTRLTTTTQPTTTTRPPTTTTRPPTTTTRPPTTTTRPPTTTVAPVTCTAVNDINASIKSCGTCTIQSSTSGTIQSYNYPNEFGSANSANAARVFCRYTITAPPGKRIQLTFTTFVVEYMADFITVYDGIPPAETLISRNLTGYMGYSSKSVTPSNPYTTAATNQMRVNFQGNFRWNGVPLAHQPPRWQASFMVVS